MHSQLSCRAASTATLTAAAVAMATAIVAPQAAAAPAVLESGSFAWPIKTSLMHHLQSNPIAKGQITPSEGASFEDSQFVFPVDAAETTIDAQGKGVIELDGEAHLQAYPKMGPGGGLGLDARYFDLEVRVDGTKAQLVGDYEVKGVPGGQGASIDLHGDDEVLVTFDLSKAVTPGADVAEMDRVTTAGPGLAKSMVRYQDGELLDDTAVDLILDYADGQAAPKPDGTQMASSKQLSADLGPEKTWALVAAGALAVLGAAGGAIAWLVGQLGVNRGHNFGGEINKLLAGLGLRL